MNIAFYSPLKSPNHPVPSGDRLMARQLIAAMRQAGHTVTVASELRSFTPTPEGDDLPALRLAAEAEVDRLSDEWRAAAKPDVWFTYHTYYKAPDLIGPVLARRFGLAYMTAEASYSRRRNIGVWAQAQAELVEAVAMAAANICFTQRDRQGLEQAVPSASLVMLPPFLDPGPFLALPPKPEPGRLITVAMMRPGDKMASYRLLAAALERIVDLPWTLSVVGDGPARDEVRALFSPFSPGRVIFHGERTPAEIASLLSQSAVYVWPGCGEAYGLAYLEAQAAGLPVVAQATAGVPEVVSHGATGLLTPPDDPAAYGESIARLLLDEPERQALAAAARNFARDERSMARASVILDDILKRLQANA